MKLCIRPALLRTGSRFPETLSAAVVDIWQTLSGVLGGDAFWKFNSCSKRIKGCNVNSSHNLYPDTTNTFIIANTYNI